MAKAGKIWRMRAGADRRFRSGHPWVYSNELSESPKGLEPGSPIELHDAGGKFLARGYGNPASLIAFRALTRDPEVSEPASADHLLSVLGAAGRLRETLGLNEVSHRLCFGEADSLPGLIIDRFRTASGQVFVVQAHTAGADRWVPELPAVLEKYCSEHGDVPWSKTGVVLRNDVGVRKLEGLKEEEPRVLRELPGENLENTKIRVISGLPQFKPLEFSVNLVGGQKTGFFLDQSSNVQLAALKLSQLRNPKKPREIHVLDLFCYVGQWSSQLTHVFKAAGLEVHVTAVDASAAALDFARQNIERQGAQCKTLKLDVMEGLESLEPESFDIVISDPPALIKGRKDLPTGTHAYMQLNTRAFRLVRKGGALISCSCSALLEEDAFEKLLAKAAQRSRTQVRWVARGCQGPDHPMMLEFPEGRYLKAWIGVTGS